MNKLTRKPFYTVIIILTVVIILFKQINLKQQRQSINSTSITSQIQLPTSTRTQAVTNTRTQQQTIALNDTLTSILKKQSLPTRTINAIIYNSDFSKQLPTLHLGDIFYFHYKNNRLQSIAFQLPNQTTLHLEKTVKGFNTFTTNTPISTTIKLKEGTVTNNFASSTLRAGMNHRLIQQFTHIFQGKLNFSRNVAPNDHFAVLYQERLINGKPKTTGAILMAQFQHRHKNFTAIRFQAPHQAAGYYDWQGKGLQPLYLKAPLHYKRISSKFSLHRLDPILHKIRPHYGVDYAAPIGTPIHSVGNGTIIFEGKDAGYGNAIKVRYSHAIYALYAHMNHFAHVKQGEKVNKGQTIGYVGETGWATGPHLHFGWYVNGIPVDPLKRPPFYNPPIAKRYKKLFFKTQQQLKNKWNLLMPPDTKKTKT